MLLHRSDRTLPVYQGVVGLTIMPTMVQEIDEVPDSIDAWLAEFVPDVVPKAVRIVSRPVWRFWGVRHHPPMLVMLSPFARWLVKRHVMHVEIDY